MHTAFINIYDISQFRPCRLSKVTGMRSLSKQVIRWNSSIDIMHYVLENVNEEMVPKHFEGNMIYT